MEDLIDVRHVFHLSCRDEEQLIQRFRAYVEAIVNALVDEGSHLHLIHLTGRVIRGDALG